MHMLQGLEWKPSEEDLAMARRAKKFGVEYQPVDNAMMDLGEWMGLLLDGFACNLQPV